MRKLSFLLVLLSGCTAVDRAGYTEHMHNYKITLISGGQVVKVWRTKGMPDNEAKSDGFRFVDLETGKLVRISGDVLIEQD